MRELSKGNETFAYYSMNGANEALGLVEIQNNINVNEDRRELDHNDISYLKKIK